MKKIKYTDLNSRQQENYNFQKVSAILADYGFSTIRLNDDWQGADFIANHIDGKTFLKAQLKGRFTIDKKYIGKEIYVCFRYKNDWYLYPHDIIMQQLSEYSNFQNTKSWIDTGSIHNGSPSTRDLEMLVEYKL